MSQKSSHSIRYRSSFQWVILIIFFILLILFGITYVSKSDYTDTSNRSLDDVLNDQILAEDALAQDYSTNTQEQVEYYASLIDASEEISKLFTDEDIIISKDYVLTSDNEYRLITTGEVIYDEELFGSQSSQPDPLAKTNGEKFIPLSVGELKELAQESNSSISEVSLTQSPTFVSFDSSKNTEDEISDTVSEIITVDEVSQDETYTNYIVAEGAVGEYDLYYQDESYELVALENNSYGAYWGIYNDTQAFFEADGTLFVEQAKGVVDVSEHQGEIDWDQVKASGVEGAIIRISYGWGNRDDYQAARNISECKRLGIPFGIYIYSYAYDATTASYEGADVVERLKRLGVSPSDLSYPVFYDLENWTWDGYTPPTESGTYTQIVDAWYNQLYLGGYYDLGVYSYTSYLNSALNSTSIHTKTRWVASYGTRTGFSWQTTDRGWQYTSSGSVAGISTRVDLNAFGIYIASNHADTLTKIVLEDGEYYINSLISDTKSLDFASTDIEYSLQLYTYNYGQSQKFRFERQYDNSYVITNVRSGYVLDVKYGQTANGTPIQQYTYNASASQRWYIRDSGQGYYLQSALGNYVLDLPNFSTSDGTQITLHTPNSSTAQKFLIASANNSINAGITIKLMSGLDSNYVLDVTSASLDNGARLQTFTWNDSQAQKFQFFQVGNGVYQLRSINSDKYLDVKDAYTENGATVQQWDNNNTQAQHWSIISHISGEISLLSNVSGKALDVPAGSIYDGNNLWIYSYNGTAAQTYKIENVLAESQIIDNMASDNSGTLADGVYTFTSSLEGGRVLDVQDGLVDNGVNIQLYDYNDSNAQKWQVTHDDQGYVIFTNVNSGKVLDVSNGLATNGTNVQQWDYNGSQAQKWIVVKNEDNTYTLYSALSRNLTLDVTYGLSFNGSNIQVYSSNGTSSQFWFLSQ